MKSLRFLVGFVAMGIGLLTLGLIFATKGEPFISMGKPVLWAVVGWCFFLCVGGGYLTIINKDIPDD